MNPSYKIRQRFFPYIILFSLFTLFQGWIPHWGGFMLLFLCIGLSLFFDVKGNNGPTWVYLAFFTFLFVVLCNAFSGDAFWSGHFFVIASNSLMILISLLFINRISINSLDNRVRDNLIRVVFIIIAITTISTAILSISNPQVIRYAMVENNVYGDSTMLQKFFRLGMSNYYLPHALPVIIPPLVLGCKNRNLPVNKRVLAGVVIFLCISLIYFSGAMTALLLGLFALIGAIIISTKSNKNFARLLIVFLLFLPFLLNQDNLIGSLRFIENSIDENNYFYDRIVDIEDSIIEESAGGDIEARSLLYNQSWEAFLSNILIGTNKKPGEHSTVLDFLASLGIIGFIPFAIFLVLVYKWTKSLLPQHVAFYSFGFFIGVLMLCLKSSNNIEMWFFLLCFLPVLTYRFSMP